MTVTGRAPRVLLCLRDNAERALVSAALSAWGAEVVLFDPGAFPGSTSLSLDPDGAAPAITAVWSQLAVGTRLPRMDPGERETCVAAAEMLVIGWLESIEAFHLDPHWVRQRADNKPHQLRIARAVGLDVPATLVSNDPEAVRAFATEHGPVVAKMLVQPIGDAGDDADEGDVVFTTALSDEELVDLDGLNLCPMIFQARMPNAGDVRATIVGRQVIAAVHDDRHDDPDWRRESYARDEAPVWSAYQLPPDVTERLLALAHRLDLRYGAADFVRRPDGSHAFLELNASGSFAFLGDPIARQVADAIAQLLAQQGRQV